MASEVADLPAASKLDATASALPAQDVPVTNGDHDAVMRDGGDLNVSAFEGNAALSIAEPTIDASDKHVVSTDPAGPTPIEDVAPGIQPISDFLPKDAPTSHPTPPPDDPVEPVSAPADALMSDDAPPAEPEQTPTSAESSLVRPREEDADDEQPAAKRSKVEDDAPADAVMEDIPSGAIVEANLEQKTSEVPVTHPAAPEEKPDIVMESQPAASSVAPALDTEPAQLPETVASEKPVGEIPSAQPAATTSATPRPSYHGYTTDPITPAQSKFLQEKMKNLKKTKHAISFLQPVDHVALNIPTYPQLITHPMDLSTMETKLKAGEYVSVQSFAEDFDQIISNTRTFNGDAHAVTQAGLNMQAYFRKMMESVPTRDQTASAKPPKRPTPPPPKAPAPARRESRSANTAAPAPAPARASGNADTFALQPDGTPQIRRDSSINRPTRTIKPPQNRELTYAKPKRKEHQLELKFCQHLLDQIRSPTYAHLNNVFQTPVDAVALNIPHYRQIIKNPMDLSTMAQKLKSGQYGKAAEFKKDFELMIENCMKFNPVGNPVRDMGIGFQRAFNQLWADKAAWEAQQKGGSQRATSASGDEDSEAEDEDDEDEGDENKAATIRALQKQLSELQNTIAGLNQPVKGKKKNKTSSKSTSKKSGAMSSTLKAKAPPAKAKPKKAKQVTYEEKQEISEAVGKMNESQIAAITKIITSNCSKFADQEEMELEIDDLPSHVQVMLLEYVRREFGNPNKRARAASPDDLAAMDDDDFEPAERGARRGGKPKKHKPMGKKEQQDTINTIQRQLAQFHNTGTSGSESPTNSSFAVANQNADTSGDESDESEEE